MAEELRALIAWLGFRTLDAMIGRVDCIVPRRGVAPAKANLLEWDDVLLPRESDVTEGGEEPRRSLHASPTWVDSPLDEAVLDGAKLSIKYGEPTHVTVEIKNHDRAAFARLAGEIARRHGEDGLPPGTVTLEATGTAGQSFGAFAVRGMLIVLEGDANDYVGKGLSGGVIAVRPPARSTFEAHTNVIVGNTVLYGATSGRAFFAGCAGERFAVRNSGAVAVVEGVGDHGCEYMTGGTVVVLGATGKNFGAGMSGGVAYVLDDGGFAGRCNQAGLVLGPIDDADATLILELLGEHVDLTRSSWGKRLRERWSVTRSRFVKVIPREYQRLLEASRASAGGVVAATKASG